MENGVRNIVSASVSWGKAMERKRDGEKSLKVDTVLSVTALNNYAIILRILYSISQDS